MGLDLVCLTLCRHGVLWQAWGVRQRFLEVTIAPIKRLDWSLPVDDKRVNCASCLLVASLPSLFFHPAMSTISKLCLLSERPGCFPLASPLYISLEVSTGQSPPLRGFPEKHIWNYDPVAPYLGLLLCSKLLDSFF